MKTRTNANSITAIQSMNWKRQNNGEEIRIYQVHGWRTYDDSVYRVKAYEHDRLELVVDTCADSFVYMVRI